MQREIATAKLKEAISICFDLGEDTPVIDAESLSLGENPKKIARRLFLSAAEYCETV